MRPPSASTDELMWLIAEEGEAASIEAFTRRYPEHRGELLKRVNMVRDLKGSRPRQAGIPIFEHRTPSAPSPLSRFRAVLIALPLAAVLFASYWVTSASLRRQDATVRAAAVAPGRGAVDGRPKPETLVGVPRIPDQAPATQTSLPPPPKPTERLVTLQYERTSLFEALNSISRATGLRFELAPDIPNQEISVDYAQIAAMTVLKDMGQALGFTPFDQGDGTVLVIPAVDPKSQDAPPAVSEGGTRIVDEPASAESGTKVSVPHRP